MGCPVFGFPLYSHYFGIFTTILPDSLIPLSFSDLRLLIPLGNDVLKSGPHDGSLELVGPFGPLLGGLLLLSLLVLAAVQHGPVDLAGVAFQQVSTVGATVQEFESLSITPDEGTTPAWVDLVATVCAKFNLHFDDPETSEITRFTCNTLLITKQGQLMV